MRLVPRRPVDHANGLSTKHKCSTDMIWIAPSEEDHDNETLEKRLWATADQFRANSGLTSQRMYRRSS